MSEWKDDAIDRYLTPIIEIIAQNSDSNFSKIEFISWFDPDVSSFSYRVFDYKGEKIKFSPDSLINQKDDIIRNLSIKFHETFVSNSLN